MIYLSCIKYLKFSEDVTSFGFFLPPTCFNYTLKALSLISHSHELQPHSEGGIKGKLIVHRSLSLDSTGKSPSVDQTQHCLNDVTLIYKKKKTKNPPISLVQLSPQILHSLIAFDLTHKWKGHLRIWLIKHYRSKPSGSNGE